MRDEKDGRNKQAQTAINLWLKQYNHIRPHQALNMKPPVPDTLLKNSTYIGGWPDLCGSSLPKNTVC
ncbi:MAG: transposase [Alphaproteobacteria bacterium]|nr:transposase [Alphaproteobacteria bacterium]